jgi:catechol-2,3-dioxygenase
MVTAHTGDTIHPQTRIGHIHLTVADLERSLAFYRDLLGFTVTMWAGDAAVFLSAGGYHHHIGLNTWAGKGASPHGSLVEALVYRVKRRRHFGPRKKEERLWPESRCLATKRCPRICNT